MLVGLGRTEERGLQPLQEHRGQQDREGYGERDPHVIDYPDRPQQYTARGRGRPDGLPAGAPLTGSSRASAADSVAAGVLRRLRCCDER
jgi:hypothetical protein